MKFIKFEEKQWAKRGRLCFANPYQIENVHWPANKNGEPVTIQLEGSWKVVLDTTSLKALLANMADDMMTEERKEQLLQNAVTAANKYKAKEKTKEKKADAEEEAD